MTTTKKKPNKAKKPPTLSPYGKRVGRPPLASRTSTLALRLSADVLDALDLYVVALAKQSPGFTVTRNDAMRRLLYIGLEGAGFPVAPPTIDDVKPSEAPNA